MPQTEETQHRSPRNILADRPIARQARWTRRGARSQNGGHHQFPVQIGNVPTEFHSERAAIKKKLIPQPLFRIERFVPSTNKHTHQPTHVHRNDLADRLIHQLIPTITEACPPAHKARKNKAAPSFQLPSLRSIRTHGQQQSPSSPTT